jgi:AraC-like DNA-binding protein/ligand-binding sensor protein
MNQCRRIYTAKSLFRKGIPASNIIKRREIDPLFLKAKEVLKFYEQAANCTVSIMDRDGRFIDVSDTDDAVFFCSLCKKYSSDPTQRLGENTYPCTHIHAEKIIEAHHAGGIYIYMCEVGFIYWSSLIYSGGQYIGALLAQRVLGVERNQVVERISTMSKGAISESEALAYIADIPQKSYEEIKALAQMLRLCTEQISSNAEEHRSMICASHDSRIASHLSIQKNYPNKKPLHQNISGNTPYVDYPLDKERLLLAALRRGDKETSRKILNEILHVLVIANPGNFEFIQLRAIELIVLLSREALTADNSADVSDKSKTKNDNKDILEINNRYIKKIQESKHIEELTGNLQVIIDCMGRQIFSFQGIRHASALRKAERYIWEHYTRKLCLQEIAAASGLSAPYFSSIFKEEMGENLSSYLNRLRVEKAAAMLTETDASINEIAGHCGFEDQSWFSKIFKSYTGLSPGKYREQGGNTESAPIEYEDSL